MMSISFDRRSEHSSSASRIDDATPTSQHRRRSRNRCKQQQQCGALSGPFRRSAWRRRASPTPQSNPDSSYGRTAYGRPTSAATAGRFPAKSHLSAEFAGTRGNTTAIASPLDFFCQVRLRLCVNFIGVTKMMLNC